MLWNHYYTINAVSSPGGVVTCTLKIIIFNRLLDLDVTEININFEINIKKYRNKKIKKNMQKDVGMACQEVCKQGRDDG